MSASESRPRDGGAAVKNGRKYERFRVELRSLHLFMEGEISIDVTRNFASTSEAMHFGRRLARLPGEYRLRVRREHSGSVYVSDFWVNG
jgi:hypothetical protein